MSLLTSELTAPRGLLDFSVAERVAFVAELQAPAGGVLAQLGAHIIVTAPAASLMAMGTAQHPASADLVAPVALVQASVSAGRVLQAMLTGPSGAVTAWGGSQIALTAPAGQLDAGGKAGRALMAVLQAPMGAVMAEVSGKPGLVADLMAPAGRMLPDVLMELIAPRAAVYAELSTVQIAAYEAWAVNLKSQIGGAKEVTHYTDYPFTRIVRFGQSYYGVADDGLYLLDGEQDAGKPIDWVLCTPTTDFGSNQKKNPASCYMGGRIGTPVSFTVFTGEAREDAYQYTSPRHENAQNHRQAFGRGLDARYYTFQAEGDGALQLDDLSFEVNIKTRRI